jgi:GNAT superfamily N-acetyltransferase
MIHSVTDENLSEVKAFLEKYRETALFLLSILETRGPSLTEDLNSGNYKCLKSPEGLQGVFCLTRRGNLLVQTEGDFTDEVLEACRKEELPIGGVLGEWETAHSLWEALLTRDSSLQTTPDGILVRSLEPGDFEEWDPLMQAFAAEEGLPLDGTPDQRQKLFEAQASKGYVWGLFLDDRLLSTADYNARSGATAQVGGVFTQPLYRRRGLSRAVIKTLIVDSVRRHSVDLLILFTRDSRGPRKLYKSFGFEPIGHYGLLFGKRT